MADEFTDEALAAKLDEFFTKAANDYGHDEAADKVGQGLTIVTHPRYAGKPQMVYDALAPKYPEMVEAGELQFVQDWYNHLAEVEAAAAEGEGDGAGDFPCPMNSEQIADYEQLTPKSKDLCKELQAVYMGIDKGADKAPRVPMFLLKRKGEERALAEQLMKVYPQQADKFQFLIDYADAKASGANSAGAASAAAPEAKPSEASAPQQPQSSQPPASQAPSVKQEESAASVQKTPSVQKPASSVQNPPSQQPRSVAAASSAAPSQQRSAVAPQSRTSQPAAAAPSHPTNQASTQQSSQPVAAAIPRASSHATTSQQPSAAPTHPPQSSAPPQVQAAPPAREATPVQSISRASQSSSVYKAQLEESQRRLAEQEALIRAQQQQIQVMEQRASSRGTSHGQGARMSPAMSSPEAAVARQPPSGLYPPHAHAGGNVSPQPPPPPASTPAATMLHGPPASVPQAGVGGVAYGTTPDHPVVPQPTADFRHIQPEASAAGGAGVAPHQPVPQYPTHGGYVEATPDHHYQYPPPAHPHHALGGGGGGVHATPHAEATHGRWEAQPQGAYASPPHPDVPPQPAQPQPAQPPQAPGGYGDAAAATPQQPGAGYANAYGAPPPPPHPQAPPSAGGVVRTGSYAQRQQQQQPYTPSLGHTQGNPPQPQMNHSQMGVGDDRALAPPPPPPAGAPPPGIDADALIAAGWRPPSTAGGHSGGDGDRRRGERVGSGSPYDPRHPRASTRGLHQPPPRGGGYRDSRPTTNSVTDSIGAYTPGMATSSSEFKQQLIMQIRELQDIHKELAQHQQSQMDLLARQHQINGMVYPTPERGGGAAAALPTQLSTSRQRRGREGVGGASLTPLHAAAALGQMLPADVRRVESGSAAGGDPKNLKRIAALEDEMGRIRGLCSQLIGLVNTSPTAAPAQPPHAHPQLVLPKAQAAGVQPTTTPALPQEATQAPPPLPPPFQQVVPTPVVHPANYYSTQAAAAPQSGYPRAAVTPGIVGAGASPSLFPGVPPGTPVYNTHPVPPGVYRSGVGGGAVHGDRNGARNVSPPRREKSKGFFGKLLGGLKKRRGGGRSSTRGGSAAAAAAATTEDEDEEDAAIDRFRSRVHQAEILINQFRKIAHSADADGMSHGLRNDATYVQDQLAVLSQSLRDEARELSLLPPSPPGGSAGGYGSPSDGGSDDHSDYTDRSRSRSRGRGSDRRYVSPTRHSRHSSPSRTDSDDDYNRRYHARQPPGRSYRGSET